MRILKTGVVLYNPRDKEPMARGPAGDVAELADGRLACRWPVRLDDGRVAFGCRDYQLGEDPTVYRGGNNPRDWSAEIKAELQRVAGCYRDLEPRREPVEEERQRVRARYPNVWREMGIEPPPQPTPTLFPVGRVMVPMPVMLGLHPVPCKAPGVPSAKAAALISWHDLVERHAAGDWGLNGQWNDATPIDDDQMFLLAAQPIETQSHAAIRLGSGAVQSRYVLPDDVQRCFERPVWQKNAVTAAEITTVLGGRGGARTLCRLVDHAIAPPEPDSAPRPWTVFDYVEPRPKARPNPSGLQPICGWRPQ
jgi:hypothetical protein